MSISGPKRIELTKETILDKCSPYDIYRHFFGPFNINEVTCNHLRGDTSPSFIIGNKYGELSHHDWGSLHWRGNCFNLVMQKYSCDYNTALKLIDKELNLGILSQKIKDYEPKTWIEPKEIIVKNPPLIQVTTRKPNKEELDYWAQYGIGLEDLKRENIFFPKTIFRNKKKIPNSIMTFCYFYPEISKIKIYRPLAPKRTKNTPFWLWKWDTNLPFQTCENLNNLKDCKYSFVTKSKKDRIVLSKILELDCIVNVQAEDPACISEETLLTLRRKSEKQVTIFDSDTTGKKSSMWLTNEYGFLHCNVPDKYLNEGIKDFADLFRAHGKEPIIEHFKQKEYI